MSAAQRKRYEDLRAAGEGWQPEHEAMLGTMPDKQLARKLGLNPETVYRRRKTLGIPSHRPHRSVTPRRVWTPAEDRLLGTMPDNALAVRLGCTSAMVYHRRKALGVRPFAASGEAG